MSSLMLIKSMLIDKALQKSKKNKKKNINKSTRKMSNQEICRTCNKEDGDIPIFNNVLQPNIPEEIQNFSGVEINMSDKFSKHMCKSCLDLLNGCILFRDICQKTNKIILECEIVKKEIKAYETIDDIEHHSEESYSIPSPKFYEPVNWECSKCNKEFENMDSHNKHLPKCFPVKKEPAKAPDKDLKKKYLCDICGKICCSSANLSVHLGTHENIFPFKCEVCPYQGRTMDLLKVHKRSHLTDKPFKCTQCPKSTTTSSNLAKHMRHVHSTSRPYKCSYCEKAFSYQHDMKRHIKDIHLRQGTVECDVCFKKFNTKKILQGHRWKIHKIKGERHGRLPSYLQCQIGDQHGGND